MQHYNNTILLKCDDNIDAIIFTNTRTDVIQKAILDATDKWYQEQISDTQLDYIIEYLYEKFDNIYIQDMYRGYDEIYY